MWDVTFVETRKCEDRARICRICNDDNKDYNDDNYDDNDININYVNDDSNNNKNCTVTYLRAPMASAV